MDLQKDLQKWTSKPFSWIGRASILKITILPRLLYFFNALPIKVTSSFFCKLQNIQRKFLWAGKKTRISIRLLMLPKRGGIGLPDFKKYHIALHITRLIDWHCHGKDKDWVHLECGHHMKPISYYPWSTISKLTKKISHPLVAATAIWHKTASQYKLATIPGPLTPIVDNPDFSLGENLKVPPSATDTNKLLVSHCLKESKIKTLTTERFPGQQQA